VGLGIAEIHEQSITEVLRYVSGIAFEHAHRRVLEALDQIAQILRL
jgi:hypothetical protein